MAFARKDTGSSDWSPSGSGNGFPVGNPLALPDIVEHWRGDSVATGAVASWTGRAGNYNLLQADAGKQPVNTAAQINGHAALIFDGTDDFLDTGASGLVIPQPWEFWLLFKRIAHTGGDFLWEMANSTLSNYAQDQAATNVRSIHGSTTFNTNVGAVGSWLLMRWKSVAGAGNSSVTLNNGTPATGTMTVGIQRLCLAAKTDGTLTPNIAVADMFIVDDALDSDEETMVLKYYRDRYGLTL